MRLTTEQRRLVLTWLAAGYSNGKVNECAAKEDPPFSITKQQLWHYRKSRSEDLSLPAVEHSGNELPDVPEPEPVVIPSMATLDREAIRSGLALRVNRIEALKQLGERMLTDLLDGDRLWLKVRRGAGSGAIAEVNTVEEFNKAEVDALRGVLEDIAAELGHRVHVQMKLEGPKLVWDMGPMDGNTEDPPAILDSPTE